MNNEPTTVVETSAPERGFRIPPPPGMTEAEYRKVSAGFVGDHRPLSERKKTR